MDTAMTKAQLLDNLRTGRAQWEALLAQVGADHMTTPGVEGDWSVKDVIAHITLYEQRTAERLEAAARNERPAPSPWPADLDMDARNALIYEAHRDQPLAEVQAESQQAFDRLVAAVEALPEDALVEPGRFAWLEGDPLWEVIPGNSYAHYEEEHTPPLRAWLAQQPA
jgi:hypothetical protein